MMEPKKWLLSESLNTLILCKESLKFLMPLLLEGEALILVFRVPQSSKSNKL